MPSAPGKPEQTEQEKHRRSYSAAMLSIISLVLLLFLATYGKTEKPPAPDSEIPTQQKQNIKPIKITIPKINVQSSIVDLSLEKDGSLQVPKDTNKVGWYVYAPPPGEVGPAVMVGHKDSNFGKAIFYNLNQLQIGDTIQVERSDGATIVFAVEGKEEYSQNNFPTQKVYGAIDYPGLRLITCSGKFQRGLGRYSHNLVVYARIISP